MDDSVAAAGRVQVIAGDLRRRRRGLLHVGHARTFWTAGERARGGTLVLRNEDLDEQRARAEFVRGDA